MRAAEVGVDDEAGVIPSSATKDAALAACKERFAKAVQDVETRRVEADGILERLLDARDAHDARGLEIARQDLDAMYNARVVEALRDPARHSRARARIMRIARDISEDELDRIPAFRARALLALRNDILKFAARRAATAQERKDVKDMSTADIEHLMRRDSSRVKPAIRAAVAAFCVAMTETDDAYYNYEDLDGDDADKLARWLQNLQMPSRIYHSEKERTYERAVEVSERAAASATATGTAVLPFFDTPQQAIARSHLRKAALDEFVRQSQDVAVACSADLARAVHAARAEGLEGGRRSRTPRASPSRSRRARALSRSRSRSKSRSR